MSTLLLEIGTEEIPAGYIKPALSAMASLLLKQLEAERIEHGPTKTYGTPRRLIISVEDVAAKQKSISFEVMGPPEKIAFDDLGKPCIAAQKFAEKTGIRPDKLLVKDTPKGRYLYAQKTEQGLSSLFVLKKILPKVILEIPFLKTMRWSDLKIEFARPILSLVALLGNKIIPFELAPKIRTNRFTAGHMFMSPAKIKVENFSDYLSKLQKANVIVDILERKQAVEKEIEAAAASIGGTVLADEPLLDVVTNLVEIPFATVGRFDNAFLGLPKEILITAMREHQKYFAVINSQGKLLNYFIAVNNTRAMDMDLVARGHERVLRARLADARFFYEGDLKIPLASWLEKLKGVLFQAQLGSMHAKTLRIERLAGLLADLVAPELKISLIRAASLSKVDLVSQAVVEFPRLQGVMGRVYALKAGESKEVALAVEEHYRPVRSGGLLPQTLIGALLGVADKLDSICGCFAVGLIPTGTSDPYALRRLGIGIIQILWDNNLTVSLSKLIKASVSLFTDIADKKPGHKPEDKPEHKPEHKIARTAAGVFTFLKDRMSGILVEEGFSKDIIAAVISVSADNVQDVKNRVAALEKMKNEPDFEPLAAAFKRVVNILKKAGEQNNQAVNPDLFQKQAESDLYFACEKVKGTVKVNLSRGQLEQALLDIASLREQVDIFFEDVMVMADDEKIQGNRLALLGGVADLFAAIADFSKISIPAK